MPHFSPIYGDGGPGFPIGPRPPTYPPKVSPPPSPTPQYARAVIAMVDDPNKPTVATVYVDNSLPARDGFKIPSSLGVKFVQAPNAWSSATAFNPGDLTELNGAAYQCLVANTNSQPPNSNWTTPSGIAFYNNPSTLTGGSWCDVDTINLVIARIEQGDSNAPPSDPSDLFKYIRHDGAYNEGGNFQNPGPIDTTQLSGMPTAINTAGPNVTTATLGAISALGNSVVHQQYTVAIGDFAAGSNPGWFAGIKVFKRAHGTSSIVPVGTLNPQANSVTWTSSVDLGIGSVGWDIGFAYIDTSANVSTIVWPSGLTNIDSPSTFSSLPSMPSGAAITVSAVTETLYESGMHTLLAGPIGLAPVLEVDFDLGDANNPPATQWGSQFIGYIRQTGTTAYARVPQGHSATSLTNGSAQLVRFHVTPGESYDAAVTLADAQGNETPQVALFTNYSVPKMERGDPIGPIIGPGHLYGGTDPTITAPITQDHIFDGVTYGRTLGTYLKSGRPYNFQGAWSSTTAYNPGDEVTVAGNYYLCITANTNVSPPSADWQLLGPATTDDLSEGTNKFAAEHGADITGNHTANDTAHVNAVAAASISPIAGLMPAEAGADVTATNYAAGTGSGTAQRTAANLANIVDGSGNSLVTRFAGTYDPATGYLVATGYGLWDKTGATTNLNAGPIVIDVIGNCHGQAVNGGIPNLGVYFNANANPQGSDPSTGYMARIQGGGTLELFKISGGSFTQLASWAVNGVADNIDHHMQVVVSGAGPTTLSISLDNYGPYTYTDSSGTYYSAGYYGLRCDEMAYIHNFTIGHAQVLSHKIGPDLNHGSMSSGVQSAINSAGQVVGDVFDGTTALSPANLTSAITNGGLVKVANATGEIPYANTSTEYQTNFNSSGLAQNTTMFNNLGICINNTAGNPGYSYTSTTTSISITIPASTYTRSDGSTASISSYSHTFSGLTASTGYYFDMWYDTPSNSFGAAIYTSGAPSAAQKLADCYSEGRTPVNGGVYIVTPSSGTGSGSGAAGSGGCPAEYQLIETQERGFIRADELELGMHLPHGSEWVRINGLARLPAPIWRFTIRDPDGLEESFDVNDTHASLSESGEWVLVREMAPGTILHGGAMVITSHYLAQGNYIAIEVEGHVYSLGKSVAHNISL